MAQQRFKPLADRLKGKYAIDNVTGCWLWTGTVPNPRPTHDYGRVYTSRYPRRSEMAHRASWRVHRGDIPDGMNVLHRCDTPRCINPEHLFLGTQDENNKDRARKGRSQTMRGSANTRATINEDTAREIKRRLAVGVSGQPRGWCVRIAKDMGVSVNIVRLISNGRCWSHVTHA